MTIAKRLVVASIVGALSLTLMGVAKADIPPFNGNRRPHPVAPPVVDSKDTKDSKDAKDSKALKKDKDADAAADKKEARAKHHKKDKHREKSDKPASGT